MRLPISSAAAVLPPLPRDTDFAVLDQLSASLPTKVRLELGEWLTERIAPRLVELDQARLQALDMVPYWRESEI